MSNRYGEGHWGAIPAYSGLFRLIPAYSGMLSIVAMQRNAAFAQCSKNIG